MFNLVKTDNLQWVRTDEKVWKYRNSETGVTERIGVKMGIVGVNRMRFTMRVLLLVILDYK